MTLLNGLFLGLSLNLSCFLVCAPVLLPYIVSESANKLRPVLLFLAGRLTAYLFFGLASGMAGVYFQGTLNPRIYGAMLTLFSIWLLAYSLGKLRLDFPLCRLLSDKFKGHNIPFIAGIVVGVNICPPFLIGLSHTLNMGSIFKPVIFFFGFFLGSSLWIVISFFAGELGKVKVFKVLGRAAAIIVGLWYLRQGIDYLFF